MSRIIPDGKLAGLLDVPLKLQVELGRTRMRLDELLKLGNGAVVVLDRLAGEPLNVYIGDKLIARGEAVTVNGHLGIKITEVLGGAGLGAPISPVEEAG